MIADKTSTSVKVRIIKIKIQSNYIQWQEAEGGILTFPYIPI